MARDFYHYEARKAIEKQGWKVTDDPLDLTTGEVELAADLGAERLIGAERGSEKIAVEIKSFVIALHSNAYLWAFEICSIK